jgi:hypothetical protein
MAKEMATAAGKAALEKLLEQLLPSLHKRFDSIENHISGVRQDVPDLRRDMDARFKEVDGKFERTQEVINELGLRINTVGTRVDTFLEFLRRDSAKVDLYLERLVRVEEAQKTRRRRAG